MVCARQDLEVCIAEWLEELQLSRGDMGQPGLFFFEQDKEVLQGTLLAL
jgi:hypothetical protein